MRLYFTIKLDFSNPDVIWLASQEMNWTIVEVNIAIVCGTTAPFFSSQIPSLSRTKSLTLISACLPSLRPIMHLALGERLFNMLSASSQGRRSSTTKPGSAAHSDRQLIDTLRPNRSAKRCSNAPESTSTSTAHDTQPFPKAPGHELDACQDTEMTVVASKSSRMDGQGARGSGSYGIMVTKKVQVEAQDGEPAEFACSMCSVTSQC